MSAEHSGYARPTRPEQLLDLQARMMNDLQIVLARNPGSYDWWVDEYNAGLPYSTPEETDDWYAINYGGIVEGDLVWVDAQMCNLVRHAMDSLPPDVTIEKDFLAFPGALVYWERSLTGVDQLGPNTGVLDATAWRHAPHADDPTRAALCIVSLDLDVQYPLPLRLLDYWPYGGGLTASVIPEPVTNAQAFERRAVAALNLLLTQPGITTTEDAPISRPFRKRAERRKQEPRVRIVRLRHAAHGGAGGNGHHLTKRFIVRGHWRNQTWGPRGSLRRPTWIAPHLKGPEGAPLDTRPTVFVANATPDEVEA